MGAGDPSRTDIKVQSMVWTIRVDHEYYVRAAPLKHRQPCFGYLIREADRWVGGLGVGVGVCV